MIRQLDSELSVEGRLVGRACLADRPSDVVEGLDERTGLASSDLAARSRRGELMLQVVTLALRLSDPSGNHGRVGVAGESLPVPAQLPVTLSDSSLQLDRLRRRGRVRPARGGQRVAGRVEILGIEHGPEPPVEGGEDRVFTDVEARWVPSDGCWIVLGEAAAIVRPIVVPVPDHSAVAQPVPEHAAQDIAATRCSMSSTA